jgi:predicted RecA/RadA family phage recombinase
MGVHIVTAGPAISRVATEVPANTVAGTFIVQGEKRGITIENAYLGANGKSYAVVGTADIIRVDANTEAFTDGERVYVEPDGVTFTATATANQIVGFAHRAKAVGSGPLHVQLATGISG